jgi:hypothetical protein
MVALIRVVVGHRLGTRAPPGRRRVTFFGDPPAVGDPDRERLRIAHNPET